MSEVLSVQASESRHKRTRVGGAAALLLAPLVALGGCSQKPAADCLSPQLISKTYDGDPTETTAIYLPNAPTNSTPQKGKTNGYEGIQLGYTDPGGNWHYSAIEVPPNDQGNYLKIGKGAVQFSVQNVWHTGSPECSAVPSGITFGDPQQLSQILNLHPDAHSQTWVS